MSLRRLYSLRSILFPFLNQNSSYCFSRLTPCSYFGSWQNSTPNHNCLSGISINNFRKQADPNLIKFRNHENHHPLLLKNTHIFILQERFIHSSKTRFTETEKTGSDERKEEVAPQKMSVFQKFKAMYRDYWYVLVPVHVVTSAMFYGSFYYMARTGVDVAALAEWAHFGDEFVEKIRKTGNSLTGHLAIAYLLYKVMTPIRYTVTIGGTTISINYLKKWGWIKPIPKRDELRRMFDDKKVELKKKRDSLRERKELMKKTVLSKFPSKKRMKSTSDLVRKMLSKKRNIRRGIIRKQVFNA